MGDLTDVTTRSIPGWPGYHVDTEGRVYSSHYRVYVGNLYWERGTGGPLRELPQFDRKTVRGKPTPYKSVAMSRDGRRVNRYVHELVVLAFLGPRPEGYEVLHGDEGSGVNRLSNLRYGTPEENSAERVLCRGAAWYRSRGMRPPMSEVVPDQVEDYEHAFAGLV